MKDTDLPAFEMLCLHYSLARQAWQMVEDEGITADTRDGIKKHPAVSVFRENSMMFKSYLVEFGLTPAARVKVKSDSGEKEKSLADLLFEGVGDDD